MSYDDIINLTRPKSKKHTPMSMQDRAAQFAPFAALTGHKDSILETARQTERQLLLDDHEKEIISQKLTELCNSNNRGMMISITYFVPDEKKAGGEYITSRGIVKKFNIYERTILFDNGNLIDIDAIVNLEL